MRSASPSLLLNLNTPRRRCPNALIGPQLVVRSNQFAPPVAQFIESSRPAARVALRLKPTSQSGTTILEIPSDRRQTLCAILTKRS